MKILKKISLGILLLNLIACVQDDDFKTPDLTIIDPDIEGNVISINAIAGLLAQAENNNETTFTFTGTEQYIVGYITSSDESSNYFEELIIQDALENPSAGIKILIDSNPLFITYDIGRRLFIKLDGLTIGKANGVFAIGMQNGSSIDKIPAALEAEFLIRSTEKGTPVALKVNLDELNEGLLNLFVSVENARFSSTEVIDQHLTYAAEPTDQFDGERTLLSCNSNLPLIVSTSTFADFRTLQLPSQQGTINGILTKDFFGNAYNLVINEPSNINFNEPNRCDTPIVNCGVANSVGTTTIFSDDFESQTNNQLIFGNGWTNYIQEGSEGFEAFTSSSANPSIGKSARVGSRNSGNTSSIAWLITPQISLNNGGVLQFMSSNSFANGSNLEVLISSNWDESVETITTSTWLPLEAAYITSDDDFFGDWFSSGLIDLSCLNGNAHIAFRYTGNGDPNFDGIYELDEVNITTN